MSADNIGLLATASGASITNSSIVGNATFGVDNTGVSLLDATNNWWGAVSGPFNPLTNPLGAGNPISTGVNFTPFVPQAVIACP